MRREMHYRSVGDMNQVILRNLGKIPEDVDLVVGIPRSGLLAGTMISLYLNRPLTDLQGLREGRLLGKGKRVIPGYTEVTVNSARRILIVDDCVSMGTELRKARTFVDELGLSSKCTFLTVFSFPENPRLADITLQIIPRPMCFQWSFMHTPELKRYCLDIDGVVCRDATKEEDDDGPNYERFLREASPLFLPTAHVGWLVTSRLEKFRPQTEAWLARHNVRYGELIMMDLPSAAERTQERIIRHKADSYTRTEAALFIESSPGQARLIAEVTGRPVMSVSTSEVIGNPDAEWWAINTLRAKRFFRRAARVPAKIAGKVIGGVGGGKRAERA